MQYFAQINFLRACIIPNKVNLFLTTMRDSGDITSDAVTELEMSHLHVDKFIELN